MLGRSWSLARISSHPKPKANKDNTTDRSSGKRRDRFMLRRMDQEYKLEGNIW